MQKLGFNRMWRIPKNLCEPLWPRVFVALPIYMGAVAPIALDQHKVWEPARTHLSENVKCRRQNVKVGIRQMWRILKNLCETLWPRVFVAATDTRWSVSILRFGALLLLRRRIFQDLGRLLSIQISLKIHDQLKIICRYSFSSQQEKCLRYFGCFMILYP